MKARLALGVLLMAGCVMTASAAWQGQVEARFSVKATMDSFVGQATSRPVAVADDATDVDVVFAIADMKTGKKKRDVEMQHMFHIDQHPILSGRASRAALDALQPGGDAVELPITLAINGVTRDVAASVTNVERGDGTLSFQADFDVSLKSFGLKAPSVMKIINVADTVKVSSRVSLSATVP